MRRLIGKKFGKFRPDIIHEISSFKKSTRAPTGCQRATLPGMIADLAKANDSHIHNHGRLEISSIAEQKLYCKN